MLHTATLERIIEFHGHMCPGLAMGIRAAEVALEQVGAHSADEEVVAIVETDMCGVDAVQFLTGCTFGKGNLVHLDYGKNAYSFLRRSDGRAVRVSTRSGGWGGFDTERLTLFPKVRAGVATPEERDRFFVLMKEHSQRILATPIDQIYDVREVDITPPPWPGSSPPSTAPPVPSPPWRRASAGSRATTCAPRASSRPWPGPLRWLCLPFASEARWRHIPAHSRTCQHRVPRLLRAKGSPIRGVDDDERDGGAVSLKQTEKNDAAKRIAGDGPHRPARRGRAVLLGCVGLAAIVAAVAVGASRSSDDDIAPPNQAVSSNVPPSFAFHRPSMAIDPVRPGHLAIASMEGTGLETCYLGLSGDGGKTWTNLALLGTGGRALPPGTTKCWNPSITYGPDGTLYYAVQSRYPNSATGKEVLLYVSEDGGLSFRAPVALDSAVDGEPGWWPDVAVDSNSGRVYMTWSRRPDARPLPGRVMLSSSTDRGLTFSPPVAVTPAEQTSTSGALLAVGPDAKVYLSYQDHTAWLGSSGKEPAQLHVSVSGDQGRSFAVSPPIRPVVPGCIVTRGFECDPLHGDGPWMLNSIAAGVAPGQVFVGWWDKEGAGDKDPTRILFSSSTDGGRTWAPPRVVGVPPTGREAQQHRPWLSVAPDGRLDIAYFSQARGGAQDAYWISSPDAGRTFSAARKLTDQASDANIGPPHFFGLGARAGDVLALTSSEDGVLAAWTDTRRGCTLSQHQDVFFTSRGIGEDDPRPAAPNSAGSVLC